MKKNNHAKFAEWLNTDVGQAFQAIEKAMLNDIHGLCKQPSVLLGERVQEKLLDDITLVVTETPVTSPSENSVMSHFSDLPLLPESIEHVIMPHTLDFSHHPNTILREVNIALRAEGCITLIGFNPFSLWGLRKLFSLRKRAPWCGRFRSLWQIRSWLDILNYEVIICQRSIHRLPILKNHFFKKMARFEPFFRYLFPFAGAIYVIVAKKKVFGVTPLRPRWKKFPAVLNPAAIKPALNNRLREVCENSKLHD